MGSRIGASEEALRKEAQETVRRMAREAIAAFGVSAERLSREERCEVLRAIDAEGAFLVKGAVSAAASELKVSVPTLYRYLQDVRGCKEKER